MISAGPLGLTLTDLTPDTRSRFGIDDTVGAGALVSEVAQGSPAADKRLQAVDVIIEMAHEAVKTPDDVNRIVEELKADGRKNILLAVQNKDGNQRWVVLPLGQ
jgi:serine protease Do